MGDRHQFRADWHDYNGGLYFVTVCTKNKIHYLVEIVSNEMNLSPLGRELNKGQCKNPVELLKNRE